MFVNAKSSASSRQPPPGVVKPVHRAMNARKLGWLASAARDALAAASWTARPMVLMTVRNAEEQKQRREERTELQGQGVYIG